MSQQDPHPLQMLVGGIVVDPDTDNPVLVLRGALEPRIYLPIFIGGAEATSIATCLAKMTLPRPMTHDLMIQLLGELCMRVHRVTITSLLEGTFYAEITIADNQGHEWQLDSRPSDAIALALRHEAGIFVSRAVLTEAGGFTDANEPEVVGGKAGDEGNAQLQRVLDEENSPGDSPSGSAARAKPAPEPPNADVLIDSDTRLEDLDPETFGKYKM